jgi:hypothetical protein
MEPQYAGSIVTHFRGGSAGRFRRKEGVLMKKCSFFVESPSSFPPKEEEVSGSSSKQSGGQTNGSGLVGGPIIYPKDDGTTNLGDPSWVQRILQG